MVRRETSEVGGGWGKPAGGETRSRRTQAGGRKGEEGGKARGEGSRAEENRLSSATGRGGFGLGEGVGRTSRTSERQLDLDGRARARQVVSAAAARALPGPARGTTENGWAQGEPTLSRLHISAAGEEHEKS